MHENGTPSQKKAMSAMHGDDKNSISYEEVKAVAKHPLQTLLHPMIRAEAPLLYRLDLSVCETTDKVGFITSDAPCVWFDSEACKRPPMYQAPALMYKTIEIRFPVSPRQMIVLNRMGLRGYVLANEEIVDELNRINRFHADEHFVVNSNVKKTVWSIHV